MPASKVLIATAGSYGDIHPYIAIGHALQDRGVNVTIATNPSYRDKINAHGLAFHPVRPDVSLEDAALISQLMDRMRGTERVIKFLAAHTREAYEDLLPAVRTTHLLLTHPLAVSAVAIAEQFRIPWASSVLAPISFLSAYDPPAPPVLPSAIHLRRLGVPVMRSFWAMAKATTRPWIKDVLRFRRELGLATDANPLFDGQHSPKLVLALFSRLLGEPQPDWPRQTVVTGFPFFDSHHQHTRLPAELERFLDAGPAPLVFTLGSSAVNIAGDFFRKSVEASRKLGLRAVLLAGPNPPAGLPPEAIAVPYAPHSLVFPRAAAVIHQGGVGTTAQAMRSGRPMLVVPFSHDQPDNAYRVRRLGIGRTLPRSRYSAAAAAREIGALLTGSRYFTEAKKAGAQLAMEDGAAAAAEFLLGQRQ